MRCSRCFASTWVRWRAGPWLLQMLLPLVLITALWIALHPLLAHLEITGHVRSNAHLAEQGLLVGLALYFTLQFLLPVFLLLHLFASYIYLGSSPLWDFIGATARNVLRAAARAAAAGRPAGFHAAGRSRADPVSPALVAQPHRGPAGRKQHYALAAVADCYATRLNSPPFSAA